MDAYSDPEPQKETPVPRLRRFMILAVLLALPALGLVAWRLAPTEIEVLVERFLPWTDRLPKQPYVQDAGPTAMTILYEADTPGQGIVKYTAGRRFDQSAAAELRETIHNGDRTTYLYRARLESLRPATQYKYRAVQGVDGRHPIKSRVATFRTWPAGTSPITFIAYGDSRTNPTAHAALAGQFESYHPDFIVHTGDVVSLGDSYNQWERQYFEPLEAVIGDTPLYLARGNHDKSAEDILRWFDFPDGHTWYSFTCGPVHVAVLDCYAYSPEVAAWLDRDLAASHSPWKIVVYHEPTVDFSGHLSHWGRDLLPILAKHRVDLVVAGHSHTYERFVPLRLGGTGSGAVTFITSGGGGARLYSVIQHPLLAKSASVHHFCVLHADAERLTMRALTSGGEEIDHLAIAKADEHRAEAAMPIASAILAEGLLEAKSDMKPNLSTAGDSHVSMTFEFPGLSGPARVTVGLADTAAKEWEMDPVVVEVAPQESHLVKVAFRPRPGAEGGTSSPSFPRFQLTATCGAVSETLETTN